MFSLNSLVTSYFIYILFGSVVIYYVGFLYKNMRLLRFAWYNNGFMIPILPFVGTAYLTLLTGDIINPLSCTRFAKKMFGFPCNVWLGHHYLLLNSDPAEIKVILNNPKCLDKPTPFYGDFQIFSNNSLFLVPYDKWKLRRKHFMKSYRPKVLKTYQEIFYKQSCDFLEELKNLTSKDNLFDVLNKYSFINFFLTSVGLEEHQVDHKKMIKFGQMLDKMQELMYAKLTDPVTPIKWWLRLFPKGRKLAECLMSLRVTVGEIIQDKKRQQADFKVFTENSNELPLLDSMLYVNGKQINDDEIVEEMMLFAGAATETSGHTMSFCFTCLGMYPQVQETLYEEIMAVVGHNTLTNENLSNLKYTEAVILETLRIFPSLPLVGRYIKEDINVGSRIIPKGTNYIISLFDLHRNSKIWPNPLNFDPTTFLPENLQNIQPYTFLPFCGGPRDCIGKVQAMMLIKTTVVNVVRHFKISSKIKSIRDIPLASCLTMKSTTPLDCSFTAR